MSSTNYTINITVQGQDKASGPLKGIPGILGNIASVAGGILGANLLQNVASGIMNMGKEALDSYAKYERLGSSLQSLVARELLNTGAANDMTAAMGAAGGKSQELLDWITKLAIQSPFNQDDISSSFRLAMAYGFTTDEAKKLTQTMVDFAAGSGASGDVMNRIALALGQIKARGKLAGQELMQLTETGLPVRQILAKAFNVTTAELEDMISKGLVPADKAIAAITETLDKDFGGAAKRQASTFSGLISSLEDIKQVGLREFFTGTFKAIQPYVSRFVDKFSDPAFMASIRQMGDRVGSFIAKILSGIEALVTAKGKLDDFFGVFKKASDPKELVNLFSSSGQDAAKAWLDGLKTVVSPSNVTNLFMSSGQASAQAYVDGLASKKDDTTKAVSSVWKSIFSGISGVLGVGVGGVLSFVGVKMGVSLIAGLFTFIKAGGIAEMLAGFLLLLPTKLGNTLVAVGGKIAFSIITGFQAFILTAAPALNVLGPLSGMLGNFALILTPLAGIITSVVIPMLLLATAVMAVVGAISLMQSGELLPMLKPLQAAWENMLTVFKHFWPFLVNVGKLLSGAFINASRELAKKIIPWLVSQLTKMSEWFKANESLIARFIMVIVDLFTKTLFPAVVAAWDVIAPILSAIIDLILGLGKIIMQVATGDWAGAWETLKNTFAQVGANLWLAITNFFTHLAGWVTSWFGTDWETVMRQWSGFGQGFQRKWDEGIAGWKRFFKGVGNELAKFDKEKWKPGIAGWKRFGDGFKVKWDEGIAGWGRFFKGVGTKWDEFKVSWNTGMDGWKNFGAGFSIKWDEGINGWGNFFTGVWGQWTLFKTKWDLGIEGWKNFGAGMGQKWNEGIAGWSNFFTNVQRLWEQSKTNVGNIVTATWNNIVQIITAKITEASAPISNLGNNIYTAFSNMKSSLLEKAAEFYDIGSKMISEIISGLSNNISSLVNYLNELIQNIINNMLGLNDSQFAPVTGMSGNNFGDNFSGLGNSYQNAMRKRDGDQPPGGSSDNRAQYFAPVTNIYTTKQETLSTLRTQVVR